MGGMMISIDKAKHTFKEENAQQNELKLLK